MRIGSFWPYSRTLIPSAEIARRNPDVLELDNHIAFAQALEAAGVDFALIADGYAPASAANSEIGFQDPSTNAVILAVPLMLATKHLGIVSTLHTTFIHPVVIARLGAHLDWVSGGRWGWNIVNGFREHEARLFGLEGELDRDGGYERSQEAVDVIKALWANPPEGIDHRGKSFSVKGKIRRPVPDELPLLVSAAASPLGRSFAATHCDYLFTSAQTADAVVELSADLQRDAAAAGKDDVPAILMLSDILIRDRPGEAQQLYAELMGTTDPEAQAAWTSHLAKMRNEKRKPGEIMTFLGTANEVAEQIVELHRACALTGLILRMPLWSAHEAARLAPVLAQLQKAGVWVPPGERGYCW
jgi:alkanesulfonate monooxygenase SsuD/methylene tetrahydromethanopterin reductase-like flavin-dependent oxidoreductase (luciferase family)